jgi:co-chaperonin GroES (HSP10)
VGAYKNFIIIIIMIIPNSDRVLVKRISADSLESAVLLPGQLKASENLFIGEVVHGGESKFKKGQFVYYSEYSAAQIIDVGSVIKKEQTMGQASTVKDQLYIVAEDDIMAYDE